MASGPGYYGGSSGSNPGSYMEFENYTLSSDANTETSSIYSTDGTSEGSLQESFPTLNTSVPVTSNAIKFPAELEEFFSEDLKFQIPTELCQNKAYFNEVFSQRTWHECLTEQQKQHLKTFLPSFGANDEEEKEKTLQLFFSKENMRFGAPLPNFFEQLKNGCYRKDISIMQKLLKKAYEKDNRQRWNKYYYDTMKEVLLSRDYLLKKSYDTPPGTVVKMERNIHQPPPRLAQINLRTKRRYFQELAAIRQEVEESDQSSEDDNYPEGPPSKLSKKQKRQLSTLECSSPEEHRVTSTLSLKPSGYDLEANVSTSHNPYEITEDAYKTMLSNHRKRRHQADNHPELDTENVTLQEIEMQVQLGKRPPINRTGQYVIETPKPVIKKFTKDYIEKRGFASSSPISLSNLGLGSPQIGVGESSNDSDFGDSGNEEDINTLEPSVMSLDDLDRLDRLDDEADNESPMCSVSLSQGSFLKTPPPRIKHPQAGSSSRLSAVDSCRSLLNRSLKSEDDNDDELNEAFNHNLLANVSPYSSSLNSISTIHRTPVDVHLPSSSSSGYSSRHLTAATLSDLDGIDMMNLPVDLDDTPQDPLDISLDDMKSATGLMQETHACFFSVIRDVICSTADHRMSLSTLEDNLKSWQQNPISPLNDWYCIAADSWVFLLPSAVNFLCGNFPDAQPDDFVPYLEFKVNLQTYQWIGAGRDSDNNLLPLCYYWLDHRDEMKNKPIKEEEVDDDMVDVRGEERVCSPPPPRCPTTWTVRPTLQEERELFRGQERLRYENPHRAFTFHMHGYESVVGPVKGVYNQSVGMNKARGHSLLVGDRPNFVTILALVRDATARLPNGEGTRTDICELLKDSQYLTTPIDLQETYLHSVVSGALDRLHYETDPCVKYDTKRKIWIYLHRGRTEEEFERFHQQLQGVAKSKKTTNHRKPSRNKLHHKEMALATAVVTKEISNFASSQIKVETTATELTTHTTPANIVSSLTMPVTAIQARPVSITRTTKNSPLARSFTLSTQALQNLQVATSSGLQTIQVTAPTSLLPAVATANKSLLATTSPATLGHQTSIPGTSIIKTVALNPQTSQSLASSTSSTPTVMKTLTIIPQHVSSVRNVVAKSTIGSSVMRMPIVTTMTTSQSGVTRELYTTPKIVNATSIASRSTHTSFSSPRLPSPASIHLVQTSQPQLLQQHKIALTKSSTMVNPHSLPITKAVNTSAPQLLNVSQVQLLGAKSHQITKPKSVLSTGKGLGLSGVKFVNAVKAISNCDSSSQPQTIYIKQPQQKSFQHHLQQQLPEQASQQQILQHSKQSVAIAQLQQQFQQQQFKQQVCVGSAVTSLSQQQTQRGITTMSVLNQGQNQPRIVTRVGGKPVPVSHMTIPAQALQTTQTTPSSATPISGAPTMVKQQPTMVAKVLTTAQGQVISMESLLAHQKHGTTLRVATAGGKPGQTSLIQIPSSTPGGVPQFAVVSQGNLISMGQPRVIQAHIPTQSTQTHTGATQTLTVHQQPQGAKLVKPLVAGVSGMGTSSAANIRMVSPAGTTGGLNLAHIGGKPVLLASKAQTAPLQGSSGAQNVILTSQGTGNQTVVLASQALRGQGGTLVFQQGATQQIILPPGFQGGTLNIKSLQGLQSLQGVKVIPISQSTNANKGRPQVYARIISPGFRPTSNVVHSNPSATVTIQGTGGENVITPTAIAATTTSNQLTSPTIQPQQ